MAERRMSQIMRQGDGLGQVLVKRKRAGNRASDLRHFDRMRQARAEQIALVVDENLSLVFETAERGAMDDAVAVALVFGAVRGCGFRILSPARTFIGGGVGSEHIR